MALSELKQAKSWQNKMEGPLLELEKLGALDADMADEIRNIVAEGIAQKFEERYRAFPGERKGVQIRRDRVPADCTLKKCFDGHAKAIMEDRLPAPIAMARKYGNMQPPPQTEATRSRPAAGAPAQASDNVQPVPKGSGYRKPDPAPERKASSGRKSAVTCKAAPTDQKTSSPSSKTTTLSEKLHKHWENGLTSEAQQAWNDIFDSPYAFLNNLPSIGSPGKAQKNAASVNQSLASPVSSEKSIAQSAQNAASKDTAASMEGTSPTKATATAVEANVDDEKDVAVTLSDDKDDGMMIKTEEHGTDSSQPTVDFGDDLIWLGD